MDLDLHESLTEGFGPEPPHRPVADRLAAGHSAVRRRRLAGSVASVAPATAVGLGVTALSNGSSERPGQVATDESATATPTPTGTSTEQAWADGDLARYGTDGQLEIRPGVTVKEQVDNPFGRTAPDDSVALDVVFQGQESWLILDISYDAGGSYSSMGSGTHPGLPWDSFEDWVRDQTLSQDAPPGEDDLSAGYVEFDDGETLVASKGVQILEQRVHPDLPENFAPADARTAAALVQGPDGKRWWVLVRDVDGLETIATPYRKGGATMEQFLAFAKERYGAEVGLR
jgi:hypothetical protein